jgi:zinc-binding alcohol dehydrogenase family protein
MVIAKQRSTNLARFELIEAGKVTACLDSRYPLSEAPQAIRDLEAGKVRGKVAVTFCAAAHAARACPLDLAGAQKDGHGFPAGSQRRSVPVRARSAAMTWSLRLVCWLALVSRRNASSAVILKRSIRIPLA